ncbi:MAG: flagellin [bacterium]
MSINLNGNSVSGFIKRSLSEATSDMALHMQRLSSGLRINSASDDAAGLGLSRKLKTQISASDIVKNNTQTGVNLLQVADADLGAMNDLMARMRDISVQSANGVYTAAERTALNAEFTNLRTEIDRISSSSSFSDLKLLNTLALSITLQIGTNNVAAEDRITITLDRATSTDFAINTNAIDTQSNAQTAIGALDTAISNIATRRSTIGSTINRLVSSISRVDSRKENLVSANSIIEDADIATESARLGKSQIRQQASATLLQQANQMSTVALSLIQS